MFPNCIIVSFLVSQRSLWGPGCLAVEVSISLTDTHTAGRSPLNQPSARRINHYIQNAQQTQATNIHALSGIRTSDPSNQAAADCPATRIELSLSELNFVLPFELVDGGQYNKPQVSHAVSSKWTISFRRTAHAQRDIVQ